LGAESFECLDNAYRVWSKSRSGHRTDPSDYEASPRDISTRKRIPVILPLSEWTSSRRCYPRGGRRSEPRTTDLRAGILNAIFYVLMYRRCDWPPCLMTLPPEGTVRDTFIRCRRPWDLAAGSRRAPISGLRGGRSVKSRAPVPRIDSSRQGDAYPPGQRGTDGGEKKSTSQAAHPWLITPACCWRSSPSGAHSKTVTSQAGLRQAKLSGTWPRLERKSGPTASMRVS